MLARRRALSSPVNLSLFHVTEELSLEGAGSFASELSLLQTEQEPPLLPLHVSAWPAPRGSPR